MDSNETPGSATSDRPAEKPRRGCVYQIVCALATGYLLLILSWLLCRELEPISAWTAATLLFPRSGMAHFDLGKAYEEDSGVDLKIQAADSLPEFERACRLLPDYPDAWLHKAWSLQTLGRLDEAVASARQCLAVDPKHALAHTLNAEVAFDRKDDLTAFREGVSAFTLDPVNGNAESFIARASARMGRPDDAVVYLSRYVALRPQEYYVHHLLAYQLYLAGHFALSVKEYDEAFKILPEGWQEDLLYSGNANWHLGNHARAVQLWNRAVSGHDAAISGGARHNVKVAEAHPAALYGDPPPTAVYQQKPNIREDGNRLLLSASTKKEILDHYRQVPLVTYWASSEFHSKQGDLLCLLRDTGSGVSLLKGFIYLRTGAKWKLAWAKPIASQTLVHAQLHNEKLEIVESVPQSKGRAGKQGRVLLSFETAKLADLAHNTHKRKP